MDLERSSAGTGALGESLATAGALGRRPANARVLGRFLAGAGPMRQFPAGFRGRRFRLTVSQGNPNPKLKSRRISPTIFLENTKTRFKYLFYLISISISAPKNGGSTPLFFFKCGGQDLCDPAIPCNNTSMQVAMPLHRRIIKTQTGGGPQMTLLDVWGHGFDPPKDLPLS